MSEPLTLNPEQQKELIGILGELKSSYGKLIEENKTLGKGQADTCNKLDKLTDDMSALHKRVGEENGKRIDAIEAAMKRHATEAEPPKSIGRQVIENEAFLAAVKSGGRFSVTVSCKGPLVKDITNVSLGLPQTLTQIGAAPHAPIGVRLLLPTGRTTAGALEYLEETTFTNNAAIVAEGAPKPKSEKVFTPRTVPVRTIAHYFKVSRQTMDDLPFLMAQIENNGIYGVQKVEDNELLNGSGVAPHLQGLMTVAAAAPAPIGTGATLIDAIGAAVFDLAAKGYMPDGSVVNPADWGHVAMLKNSQGNYLFANPIAYSAQANVWGTRMVLSSNQAAGNFLVGAFAGNAQLLDREDVNVQVATQNEDDFIKNMVTVLVEERIALVIYQPGAFEKGVTPAGAGVEAEGATRNRRG